MLVDFFPLSILSGTLLIGQQIDAFRDKLNLESQQLGRTAHLHDQATTRVRVLEDERNMLEAKVHKLESELSAMELSRESLRKDKANVSTSLL
jgi:cell division protein FtsB